MIFILLVLWLSGFIIVTQSIDILTMIGFPENKSVSNKTALPQVMDSLKVSKLVKADEGGDLSAKDTNGVEITFSIPANSLKKDETIELTPIVGNDPGVEIKPLNLVLEIPGSITFNYHPVVSASLIPIGNMGQVQGDRVVMASPTPQAEEKKPKGRGNSGVIYIDATGETHVWPSYESNDGNVTTTAKSGGYYSAGDIDKSTGDKMAEAAAKNLDKSCRGQAWEDFVQAIAYANQNYDAAWWYAAKGAANKCMDERIVEISAKCANDKITVRRRDIQALEYLAMGLRLDGKLATLKGLESSCVSKYAINEEKTNVGVGVGNTTGTITHKIEAEVCGYVDDEWRGNDSTTGCSTGSPSCQDWATNFKMRFPSNGGRATFSEVKGQMSTRPIVLTFPLNVALTSGDFVLKDQLNLTGGLGLVKFTTKIITLGACTPEAGWEPINPYNPNK